MVCLVSWSWATGNADITDAGWATLSAGVRRNPHLALKLLFGVDLGKYDDTLPAHVVAKDERSATYNWNMSVLSHYCAQARIRRRVAAVAVLRTAWHRNNGRPGQAAAQATRVAALAHMLQLRRLCRVPDGKAEVVEPFGRAVVAFL